MGHLQYPQKREIKGPWLICQEDLEKLDVVLLNIDALIKKSWESQIQIEVYSENSNATKEELENLINERKDRSYGNVHEKKCEFITKDEHKLLDVGIMGLLRDNTLKTLSPREFHANIVHGAYYQNKFDLRISDLYRGDLRYEIECFDSSIRDEVQYEIDKWIDKLKPNRVLQFWSNYSDLFVWFLLFPLIFLGVFGVSTSFSSYSDVLKTEASEIINHGIDSTNRDAAIVLLLKSESGYIPKDFIRIKKPMNPVFLKLLILGIVIYIFSFFPPKTTIGVGKMKQRLVFYKFWIKLVTVTLPTILILAPFWKTITNWLY